VRPLRLAEVFKALAVALNVLWRQAALFEAPEFGGSGARGHVNFQVIAHENFATSFQACESERAKGGFKNVQFRVAAHW